MFKIILLLSLSIFILEAKSLRESISNMFIIGFEGYEVPNKLKEFIKTNSLGGVILFSKNIKDPKSLKLLTTSLQSLNQDNLLIGVDEEGGFVSRLGQKDGFKKSPKAIDVANSGEEFAKKIYKDMAIMLKNSGINLNFAPCVDLAINPKNRVIVKYGRSFSSDENEVIKYASIFMNEMQKERVGSVIKHFPGHGSSLKDSHDGFVDVSDSWSKRELIVFFKLKPKAVMSAHIYNRHLDKDYPATLSKKTLDILRDNGFNGVIVSDDLQMGAIRKNFDLNETLSLAINSGVDLLLFGNQLSKPEDIEFLVSRVEELVKRGVIDKESIKKADIRIDKFKRMVGDR
jgi:beta-N-acetylhexosaminidase